MHGDRGPLVVALHGLAESGRYWSRIVDWLAPDHRVLTIDLLGFGRSPWPMIGYSAGSHADQVLATVRHAVGTEPALLLAHQAGVTVAMELAARAPAAATGVVGLSTPWYRSDLEARRALRGPWWLSRWLVEHEGRARVLCRTLCGGRTVVPRMARWFGSESLPADVVEDVFLHHWGSLSGTLRSCWIEARLPDRFRAPAVPLLALHGDDDLAVPVENLLDAAATRPWLGVERLPGRTFNLALDHPDVVADVVAELAAARRPGPGRPHLGAAPTELSVADAAALARAHKRTVLSWIEQGSVEARRERNQLVVDRASLLDHLFGADVAHPERLLAVAWLGAAEAAARLGVSTTTLHRLRDDGLPSHRIAGRRVYLAEELDAWASAR